MVLTTELHKTLEEEEIVFFLLLEASVREENVKRFHFKNYHFNFLPKSRKLASGILIGTCKPLQHIFSIVKSINVDEKKEIIKLTVCKTDNHVKIFGIYAPPQNNPALSFLDVSR